MSKEPQVLIKYGIRRKKVYLEIDCPDHVTAGRYFSGIESWISDIRRENPARVQVVIGKEKGDGLN